MQYFVGLPGYPMEAPFVPSLLVEIRKRMSASVFDVFQAAIIDSIQGMKAKQKQASGKKPDPNDHEPATFSARDTQDEEPARQG